MIFALNVCYNSSFYPCTAPSFHPSGFYPFAVTHTIACLNNQALHVSKSTYCLLKLEGQKVESD